MKVKRDIAVRKITVVRDDGKDLSKFDAEQRARKHIHNVGGEFSQHWCFTSAIRENYDTVTVVFEQ